jgi:hypothetical protein
MYSRKLIVEQWCNSETIKGPTKRSVDSAGARATCAREKRGRIVTISRVRSHCAARQRYTYLSVNRQVHQLRLLNVSSVDKAAQIAKEAANRWTGTSKRMADTIALTLINEHALLYRQRV